MCYLGAREESGKRKGIVKKLSEVFFPVREVKKFEQRKLIISPKGKIISKNAGNSKKMPKGGNLQPGN